MFLSLSSYLKVIQLTYTNKMPIKDYPFTPVTPSHARPMLWIRVTNPHTNTKVVMQALLDTGADSCAFPADTAEQLGHNLRSAPATVVFTASGQTEAFAHTSRVDILEMRPDGLAGNKVLYTIDDTPIDFIQGCDDFLLGVRDFLEEFVLTIDYPRQRFSIRKAGK